METQNNTIESLGITPKNFENLPTPEQMRRERIEAGNAYPKSENTDLKVAKIVNTLSTRQLVETVYTTQLSKHGLCQNEPMESYLESNCISSGDICEVNRSGIHYVFNKSEEKNNLDKFRDTSHFDLGTFAHMAFLEPKLFSTVEVEPSYPLSSHDGVNALIEFYQGLLLKALGEGMRFEMPPFAEYEAYKIADKKEYLQGLKDANPYTMIDEKHKIIIDIISRNYYEYAGGLIPKLLAGSMNETSFYYSDEESGLEIKVRPDALLFEENIGINAVVSFKTTRAESVEKYLYDAASLKYHVKEAAYQHVVSKVSGRDFNTTIMIMLQTVPPYLPAVMVLDDADMEASRHEMEIGMDKIRESQMGKKPLGFETLAEEGNMGIITPKFPSWISKAIQDTI